MQSRLRLAVVVVCHNSAAHVGAALRTVAAQLCEGDELVVVDNASSDSTVDAAREAAAEARVVETGANLGFGGGCHAGARVTGAELLFFLNPDAEVASGAIEALRSCGVTRPDWGAWQALVTLADRSRVNTAGNPVHFLGFGWAGRLGEPVGSISCDPEPVASCSGAALVVRRTAWNDVGGFDERYFMYGEDVDLSLRLRLAGWGTGLAASAVVTHDYEFAKGDYKWFYLERNRWWTVLGVYPIRLLGLLLPALLAFEFAVMLVAWRGGWLRAKVSAQRAVARQLPQILGRRRAVQATACAAPRIFIEGLSSSLDSPYLALGKGLPMLPRLNRAYWRLTVFAIRGPNP